MSCRGDADVWLVKVGVCNLVGSPGQLPGGSGLYSASSGVSAGVGFGVGWEVGIVKAEGRHCDHI